MREDTKSTLIISITVFLTLSSIAWAIDFTSVYKPQIPSTMTDLLYQCLSESKIQTQFCAELIKKAAP